MNDNDQTPETTPMHSLEEAFPREWERLDNLARDAGYHNLTQMCNELGYWDCNAPQTRQFLEESIELTREQTEIVQALEAARSNRFLRRLLFNHFSSQSLGDTELDKVNGDGTEEWEVYMTDKSSVMALAHFKFSKSEAASGDPARLPFDFEHLDYMLPVV